jgi:hypothetical protein
MTTALQAAANARNGSLSKGPKSLEGKAASSKNALRHGLAAVVPVIPGERAEDWQEFRSAIVESLAPFGAFEEELAERVALASWRLRRVVACETAVTTVGLEEVSKDVRDDLPQDDRPRPLIGPQSAATLLARTEAALAKKRHQVWEQSGPLELIEALPERPDTAEVDRSWVKELLDCVVKHLPGKPSVDLDKDPSFRTWLGAPKEGLDSAFRWDGWTAGLLRKTVAYLAGRCGQTSEQLLETVQQKEEEALQEPKSEIRALERDAKKLRREVKECEDRLRRRRMLPDDKALDKVVRYESHLNRQMLQALHTLERLQAARAGRDVPPPAALDITVDADAAGVPQPIIARAAAVLEHRGGG